MALLFSVSLSEIFFEGDQVAYRVFSRPIALSYVVGVNDPGAHFKGSKGDEKKPSQHS